jgi:predicted extracellular nuclease
MPPLNASAPRRLFVAMIVFTLVASFSWAPQPARAADGSELFFSEYVEGSGNNKALEIYNPTDNPIDLGASGYGLQMIFNGGASKLVLGLSGTIAPADVFVVANASGDPELLALADQTDDHGWFNGDDAVLLLKTSTPIDAIGQANFDPGDYWGTGDVTTKDHTLRRKPSVTGGDLNFSDAFDPSVEWDAFPQDTFSGLGSHTIGASGDASVWINEIHYDNDGTDVGEAIEVAGTAGTDLSGWSLVLYNGSNGSAYDTKALSGMIPDQQNGFGTIAFSYPSNGIQNGSPDGIALMNGTGVVQFLSYEGTLTAVGGPADGMASADIGVTEAGNSAIGDSLQLTGSGTGHDDFSWSESAPNTFGALNTGQAFGEGANAPVVLACNDLQVLEGDGGAASVSSSDADGVVTQLSITAVEPATDAITLASVQPATTTGGTASATLAAAATAAAGGYDLTITATNADATPQTGSCELTVTVSDLLTVGEVQGQTTDGEDGTRDASPYAGQSVYVRGVVTERVRLKVEGRDNPDYAFYLQSATADGDGDPLTSDGIYVYMSRFTSLLREGSGSYFPTVGDEITVHGPVSEYFNLTELSNPRVVRVDRTGVDVDGELQVDEAQPPHDLADADRYWERHEGMLMHLDAGAVVTSPRDVFSSTSDGEVWVVSAHDQLAQRTDPYARRVFRDFHPLDDDPALVDNGNGMRILLTSHGIKWDESDSEALIAPARSLDTTGDATHGAVYYAFGKYSIEPASQVSFTHGADPALNAPPQPAVAGREFATSDYNVENLYDFRDDPFDGCDFDGNSGCQGVSPPFDYVPASEAAYQQHLTELAAQITGPMHSPDLLMIQEAEDQDICSVAADAMVCGAIDDADGQPDVLQELALVIADAGGPRYLSAYDRDGADDRGIVSAFMYRADSVELLPVDAAEPVLGSSPGVDYRGAALAYNSDASNPKALNADLPSDVDTSTGRDGSNVYTRAPQVGHFRVWRDGIGQSVFTDLYAISNHFSSGPDTRVGQRTEQAAYNAAIVAALRATDPAVRVVSAGDFNVFPRPDDPFPDDASDQLGPMYAAGLHNLFDVLLADVPSSAYSYTFEGQAQTLDQQFATASQFDDLVQVRAAHINADFPAAFGGDGARGASDHDPQLARWSNEVTVDRLADLVDYYVATGAVQASKAGLLYDRLNRAARFLAAGQTDAYRSQLIAFGDQAQDLAPRWVAAGAAGALEAEADRLAAS